MKYTKVYYVTSESTAIKYVLHKYALTSKHASLFPDQPTCCGYLFLPTSKYEIDLEILFLSHIEKRLKNTFAELWNSAMSGLYCMGQQGSSVYAIFPIVHAIH